MYTSHGHHIPGTTEDAEGPVPDRCGGIRSCRQCNDEAVQMVGIVAPTLNPSAQQPEPNVFERAQENRVLSDSDILNRFGWHRATEITGPRHKIIREKFAEMAQFLDTVLPNGREKAIAQTELQTCALFANAAVAQMAPVVVEP